MAASIGTVDSDTTVRVRPGIWIATLALTAVILIFLPSWPRKLWPRCIPKRWPPPASYVLTPLLKVLYPFVWVINLLASGLLRPFGVRKAPGHHDSLKVPGKNCALAWSRKAGGIFRSTISRC